MNTLPPPAPIFRPYCTPVALALAALRLGDENQARNPIGAGFDLAQTAFPFATEVEVPMAFEMFSVPLHLRAGRQVAGIRQFEIKHIEGAASEIAQFLVDYDQSNSASDLEAQVGKTTKLWTVSCDSRLLGSVVMSGDAPPPGFVLTPALALEALERSIYAGKTSRLEFKFNCEVEDPGNRRGVHQVLLHECTSVLQPQQRCDAYLWRSYKAEGRVLRLGDIAHLLQLATNRVGTHSPFMMPSVQLQLQQKAQLLSWSLPQYKGRGWHLLGFYLHRMASHTNASLSFIIHNNREVLDNVLTWLRFMDPQVFANAFPAFPNTTTFDFNIPVAFGHLYDNNGQRVSFIRVRYSTPPPNLPQEYHWEVRFDHHTYAALSVPQTVVKRVGNFRLNAQDVLFSLLCSLHGGGRRVQVEIGTGAISNHTIHVPGPNNTMTKIFGPIESAPLRIRLWYDNATTNTSTPSSSSAEVWTLGYHLCGKLRCNIAEVVDLIFSHLDDDVDDRGSTRTFASLSRTCRALREPALDGLWRTQNTLNNLLRGLPADAWEITSNEDGFPSVQYDDRHPWQFRLLRVLHANEWDGISKNAHRIRSLTIRKDRIGLLPSPAVRQAIASRFPEAGSLLPNLRRLVWEQSSHSSAEGLLAFAHLFLGPRVDDLSVFSASWSFRDAKSINVLCFTRWNTLRHVSVGGHRSGHQYMFMSWSRPKSETGKLCSAVALKLDQVETLTVDTLDNVALRHLRTLLKLRELELRVPNTSDLGRDYKAELLPLANPFPSLESVVLHEDGAEYAAALVRILADSPLRKLTIRAQDMLKKEHAMGLYFAIAQSLSPATFQEITLGHHPDSEYFKETPRPGPTSIPGCIIDAPTLLSLARFTNLTKVALYAPVGFDIDDAVIWQLAKAWPRIVSLELDAFTRRFPLSRVTLTALRAFALRCPLLESLRLSVDAKSVPPPPPQPIPPQNNLRLWNVGVSAIDARRKPDIAQFLAELFPKLVSIEWRYPRWGHDGIDDDEEDSEEEFNSMVQDCYLEWDGVGERLKPKSASPEPLLADEWTFPGQRAELDVGDLDEVPRPLMFSSVKPIPTASEAGQGRLRYLRTVHKVKEAGSAAPNQLSPLAPHDHRTFVPILNAVHDVWELSPAAGFYASASDINTGSASL
ncbi:hypothetical protein MKEN_00186600 [Mycena kentingensis (nom. inval.)]|nr:hypothetical protein MKEN_00186600 [Mycena kentingensis (nom. inval.)]